MIFSFLKNKLTIIILSLIILISVGIGGNVQVFAANSSIEAKVISQYSDTCPFDKTQQCKLIDVTIFNSDKTIEKVTVVDNEGYYRFGLNDRIWVTKEANGSYYLQLPNRTDQLLWIVAIFFIVTILFIGKKGIRAIITLVISTSLIFFVAIPAMISRPDSFWLIGIVMVFVVMAMNILIGQGFSKNTVISLAGSVLTVIVVAAISWLSANITKITGLGSESALFLQSDPITKSFNLAQIFQIGTLLGISGAVDDVTNAQAIIVDEQPEEEVKKGLWNIYNRGMRLGSTHIVSMINTLFLAYLGVGLTTVLLFQTQALADNPLSLILSRDDFSEEILRTIMASFAVVLAIPITTIIAAWVKTRTAKNDN